MTQLVTQKINICESNIFNILQLRSKKICQTLQKYNCINSNEVLTICTFKTVFADCDFLC